jgi:rare lipoprotein A
MTKQLLIISIIALTITQGFAKNSNKYVEVGKSSWYGVSCNGGTQTASGQKLKNNANTAAHKTLPFGTLIKVTNLKNGKSEVVKITDRGPYIGNRILDVTVGVSEKLGFKKNGITTVKIEKI